MQQIPWESAVAVFLGTLPMLIVELLRGIVIRGMIRDLREGRR